MMDLGSPLMFRLFRSLMEVLRLDGFDCKACLRTTGVVFVLKKIDGFDFDLKMAREFLCD